MMPYYATSLFLLKTCTFLSIVGPNVCYNTTQGLLVNGLRLSTKLEAAAGGGEAHLQAAAGDVVYAYTGSWKIERAFGGKVTEALQTDKPFENIELRVIEVEPERKVGLFITTIYGDINVGEVYAISFLGNTLLNVIVEDGEIVIRFDPESEMKYGQFVFSKQAVHSFKTATGEWHPDAFLHPRAVAARAFFAARHVPHFFTARHVTRAAAARAVPATAAVGAPSAEKAKGGAEQKK